MKNVPLPLSNTSYLKNLSTRKKNAEYKSVIPNINKIFKSTLYYPSRATNDLSQNPGNEMSNQTKQFMTNFHHHEHVVQTKSTISSKNARISGSGKSRSSRELFEFKNETKISDFELSNANVTKTKEKTEERTSLRGENSLEEFADTQTTFTKKVLRKTNSMSNCSNLSGSITNNISAVVADKNNSENNEKNSGNLRRISIDLTDESKKESEGIKGALALRKTKLKAPIQLKENKAAQEEQIIKSIPKSKEKKLNLDIETINNCTSKIVNNIKAFVDRKIEERDKKSSQASQLRSNKKPQINRLIRKLKLTSKTQRVTNLVIENSNCVAMNTSNSSIDRLDNDNSKDKHRSSFYTLAPPITAGEYFINFSIKFEQMYKISAELKALKQNTRNERNKDVFFKVLNIYNKTKEDEKGTISSKEFEDKNIISNSPKNKNIKRFRRVITYFNSYIPEDNINKITKLFENNENFKILFLINEKKEIDFFGIYILLENLLKKISTNLISPKILRRFIPPNIINFKSIKSIYRYRSSQNSLEVNYTAIGSRDEEYINEKSMYKTLLKSDAFTI